MLRALLITLFLITPLSAAEITFTVSETAGLRRFGYPVEAVFALPQPVEMATGFRIVEGKQSIAQVRPSRIKDGKIVEVIADFAVSLRPKETRTLKLQYGPDVVAEEGKGDTLVEAKDGGYLVTIGGLRYDVPKNLLGLFRSVAAGKGDYLRGDSTGLQLVSTDKTVRRIGASSDYSGTITRSGPRAVAVRFTGKESFGEGKDVTSTIDLTFPRSKSWVQVDWRLDDPNNLIVDQVVDLNLLMTGETTLIDFGASTYVYTTLKKDQFAFLEWRGPVWSIQQGQGAKYDAFALPPPGNRLPPEGWAHVMDRQRCTAFATTDLASASFGEIRTQADGRLSSTRRYENGKAMAGKRFTFWFHFVPMPVQIGALTSPQSMQNPLEVKIITTP